MAMVRTFFAVRVPECHFTSDLLEGLRGAGENVKVVDGANLHITLKFLGETPEKDLDAISNKIREDVTTPPFDMTVKGTGYFRRKSAPSALWAGVEDGGMMSQLASQVDDITGCFGFEKERRKFKPHLTLARVKQGKAEISLSILDEYRNREFQKFTVDRFHFVKSTLTPQGPIYEDINTFFLRG